MPPDRRLHSSGDLKANNIPDETSAELVTNIMVKDGETIVIGGLFRDTIKANKTKIPLLGDIPLFGVLFRGTADQMKKEEVIILLTPHIIEEPSETEGQARADDVSRKRYGAKDAMLPIGGARLAEDFYAIAVKYYLEGKYEFAMRQVGMALRFRPTYLEAIRLKERIIAESSPGDVKRLERIMTEVIDKKEAEKWLRR